MSSIVTAVFKATIGLLVNKGRDKAAEKLKDGDVTDQKFRGLIVREIDDIKSKLDGLSRKDLLASISFFEEGIELLYEVFDQKLMSRSEYGAVTAQAACAEAFSVAEGMRNLTLTGLDESATMTLSKAKKRFEDARKKATEAFVNEALKTPDRILAMQYRVMATILETVDNPADAIAPCRVCIKELNCLPAVQNSFAVQLKKGIQAVKGLFGKDERGKIISRVSQVNRAVYDVTQAVGKDVPIPIWMWPTVDTGEDKVDPLRDERVTNVLRKHGMDHCCVTPWTFGQEGEVEHKLMEPRGITTNSNGQFIVGDNRDRNVKVFDSSGKFMNHFSLSKRNLKAIDDVATDMNNIYVLVTVERPGVESHEHVYVVFVFNDAAGLHHEFSVGSGKIARLTVNDSGKVMVLRRRLAGGGGGSIVHVYKPYGQFVRSFGEGILEYAYDITAVDDGHVMVLDQSLSSDDYCVHIFSEQGNHLNKFKVKLQGDYHHPSIAFHRATEHVVAAADDFGNRLQLQIYTKDGEFVRSTQVIHEEGIDYLQGMTVTTEGRIAVVSTNCYNKIGNVLVV